MLKAYHMIGLNSADFFRLREGRIAEGEIVEQGRQIFEEIIRQEAISSSAGQGQAGQSRQFHLDRLVGDDQYVYLSVGKRYWNDPASTNFGFVFDAGQLLLQQNAILRTHDLLEEYGDLLEMAVRTFVPDRHSPAEIQKLLASIEDPESDYLSPNDAYYTLIDAVEHQQVDIPQAKEATDIFLRLARDLQQASQCTGEQAVKMAHAQGKTGQFELLVKDALPLSCCIGTIQEGREYLGYPYHVKCFGKKYGVVLYFGTRPVGEILYDLPTHAQRRKRQLNRDVKGIDEMIKRDGAIIL